MKHAGTWKLQWRLHACVLLLRPLNDCRSRLFGTASLLPIHIARVFIASVLTASGTAVPPAIPSWGHATTTSDGRRRFPPIVTAWRRRDRQWCVYRREAGAGGWILGKGHFFRARDAILGSGDPISRSRDNVFRVTPPPVGISTHLLMPGAARLLRAVLASVKSSGQ